MVTAVMNIFIYNHTFDIVVLQWKLSPNKPTCSVIL